MTLIMITIVVKFVLMMSFNINIAMVYVDGKRNDTDDNQTKNGFKYRYAVK